MASPTKFNISHLSSELSIIIIKKIILIGRVIFRAFYLKEEEFFLYYQVVKILSIITRIRKIYYNDKTTL